VSLKQLESDEFQFTVLKIHVTEENHSIHNDEGDVCIGTVISGLETLMKRLPKIPIIHKEDDDTNEGVKVADNQRLPSDQRKLQAQNRIMDVSNESLPVDIEAN
jgi:hypothetical protein